MNGDIHFVSDFNAREIHQSGIEDDPLRVSDFSDGLRHAVILCFTAGGCQTYTGAEKLEHAGVQKFWEIRINREKGES